MADWWLGGTCEMVGGPLDGTSFYVSPSDRMTWRIEVPFNGRAEQYRVTEWQYGRATEARHEAKECWQGE